MAGRRWGALSPSLGTAPPYVPLRGAPCNKPSAVWTSRHFPEYAPFKYAVLLCRIIKSMSLGRPSRAPALLVDVNVCLRSFHGLPDASGEGSGPWFGCCCGWAPAISNFVSLSWERRWGACGRKCLLTRVGPGTWQNASHFNFTICDQKITNN